MWVGNKISILATEKMFIVQDIWKEWKNSLRNTILKSDTII